jgi:hypothetical protein
MELQYRTRNGRLLLKMTGESQKDLFRWLATMQEVFEAEANCGCCKSEAIRFHVRTVDAFDFFELVCACGARFEFGQHRNGTSLFPKRRDEHGALLPDRGWKVWKPEGA